MLRFRLSQRKFPTPLEQVKATAQLEPTAIPMPPDQPVASLKLATRPCHQVGDLIWVHRVDTGEVRSSPAVVEGVAYVSAIDGHVYALEADTGKRIWRSDTLGYGGYRSNNATTAADGIVYTGSNSGYVAALDMTTGESPVVLRDWGTLGQTARGCLRWNAICWVG